MNSIIKITNFITKKSSIKMLAVILIVGIFFFHRSYAANENLLLSDVQNFLDHAVGFLSRIWIFLAIIAGKLMTNDVVYGAFMNLDKYLRNIRNVMKNFANFGLAFMILISIVKYVIDKKGDGPKKIVVNALLAGVLIQMSWFAVGALVDLSTVATSAIAAFPAKFIGNSPLITEVKSEFNKISKNRYTAEIDEKGQLKRKKPEQKSDASSSCNVDSIDAIMPKYDSVSGPLIFIGMSFLKTQSYMNHGPIPQGIAGGGQLIINLALKALILLAYVGCLIGLVIANLIRVLFLRLLIMVSPVVILIGVFGKKLEGEGGGMTKYFNFQTFADLIFKPLFFIGFIGLTLIFVTSMQQIMGGNKGITDMQGVSIYVSTGYSKIDMAGIADFQVNGEVFGDIADDTKTVFVDLLLIFMTLFLLRQMLKWSIEFGGGPVKDIIFDTLKLDKLVESFAANVSVIPMGGGEAMGLKNILDASSESTKKMLKSAGISESGKFYKNEEKFQNMINEKFLGIKPGWGDDDTTELKKIIRTDPDNFWGAFLDKGKKTSGGVTLSDSTQLSLVKEWFDKDRESNSGKGIEQNFGHKPAQGETFDHYFKESPDDLRRQMLHDKLGGEANMEHKKAGKQSYDDLLKNKYYFKPRQGE